MTAGINLETFEVTVACITFLIQFGDLFLHPCWCIFSLELSDY